MPSLLPSPRCALTAPFHPYRPSVACAVKGLGGLFSVALSVGSRPPGVTWHLIRRSPDFPPPGLPLKAFAPKTHPNSDYPADSPPAGYPYSWAFAHLLRGIAQARPPRSTGATRRGISSFDASVGVKSPWFSTARMPRSGMRRSIAPQLTLPALAAIPSPTTPQHVSTAANQQWPALPPTRGPPT
jgi:hypothetical protein